MQPIQNESDVIPDMTASQDQQAIIAASSYIEGETPRKINMEEVSTALLNPNSLVWIGLKSPSPALIDQLSDQLALGDDVRACLSKESNFPRLYIYDSDVLFTVPTIHWEENQTRPHFGKICLLIGNRYLLTIRTGISNNHSHFRERLERNRSKLDAGSDHVAVELIDELLDRYLGAYKLFEKRVDRTERSLIRSSFDRATITSLYILRRDFHRLHTAIEPIGEICSRLAHLKAKPLSADSRLRFEGLAERITHLDKLFDSLSQNLTFAFEAGMLIEQQRQTDTTRKLAAWAAIISLPTCLAGIYGMNFENMPELKLEYGYEIVLGTMVALCTSLFVMFKRAKWL